MLVRDFLDDDHQHLARLLELRMLPRSLMNDLPLIGLIAFDGDGVCAGCIFLRMAEGDFGLIEGMITNPNVSSIERHVVLEKLVAKILDKAEGLNIKKILSYTEDYSVVMRAQRAGFKVSSQMLLIKGV
jgi:N-acetylglutamate synthase-like GNAT family acetyltransferase